LTFRGEAAAESIKKAVAASNSIGMMCFEATPSACTDLYKQVAGTDIINGRTVKEVMSVVAKGAINGSLRPYQIIRLQ